MMKQIFTHSGLDPKYHMQADYTAASVVECSSYCYVISGGLLQIVVILQILFQLIFFFFFF